MVLKAMATHLGNMTTTSGATGTLSLRIIRRSLSVFSNHNELMVLTSDVTFGFSKSEGYLPLYEKPRRDLLRGGKEERVVFF